MATLKFNQYFRTACNEFFAGKTIDDDIGNYHSIMMCAKDKGAMFDSRCFNIPKEEVTNCFIWRQQDATRNAIQMLGQTHFTHKELQNKSCNDIQDMLMLQKGINFNDMPTEFKRGVCCIKKAVEELWEEGISINKKWYIDKEIPIFTQDRAYLEKQFMENE
jgi:tRNA(His) 5'-end guanylyltransferase